MNENESIKDYYKANQVTCTNEISRYSRLINNYSFLRLFSLLFGIVLFYQSFKFERVWLTELVLLSVVVCFAWLVKKQSQFEKRKVYFVDLGKVNINELNSIERQENLYQDGTVWIDGSHPYSSDLDIFGKGSVFNLINRCSTVLGNSKLASWLKEPASASIIRERQSAVKELTSKQTWKQNFQTILLFSNKASQNQVDQLFQYLKSASRRQGTWLRLYIKWIPLIFLLLAMLCYFSKFFLLIIITTGITNLFITEVYNIRIKKTESSVGKVSSILILFSEAISKIKQEKWESELCLQLTAGLGDGQQGKLSEQIKLLASLINRLALGYSFAGFALNFTMAWNVRQFFDIEDWKLKSKVNLEHAFDIIASFEALISISSLKSNYPAWSFPEIKEDENYTLNARSIGHPLILINANVRNKFTLNNELKIDIITGSNMAGKSTFLRTLGVNTVLALSGAPVCAIQMSVTPMLIFSYMRISDSLNENTSTFKAELDRLKSLLHVLNQNEKVYFLIDEMLRGTNSVDKYLGSKAVIEKLISQRAVGIVATHDLQIAQLEQKYPYYIRNFYFDIQVEGDEMKFDYKLKLGECKSFNASILLRRIGVNVE